MKKQSVLLALLFFSMGSIAQRTLVAPVNPPRIFPRWTGGDRDFWGHGPKVTGDVRIAVSEGKSQIIAFINLRMEEIGGNGSLGTIDETRLVYSAPAGKQIKAVHFPTDMNSHFDFKMARGGLSRVRPTATNGPVNWLTVHGDTGGPDIGNNTNDDSHITVTFRGFVVELEPLAPGIREITLAKNLMAGMVADRLRSTTGKLNTYGPRVGDSWFKAKDAWIKFPNDIRRDTMYLEQLQEIRILPRRYYYNDVRLSGIRGNSNREYLRLNVGFESEGPELRGECVDDIGCGFGTPTVQLDNLSIQINVRPIVAEGQMSFDPHDVQVVVGYNFSADCGILTELCKEVFKDPLQSALFNMQFRLADILASPDIRREISNALNAGVLNAVHTLGRFPEATRVIDVRDAGTSLVIRCQ